MNYKITNGILLLPGPNGELLTQKKDLWVKDSKITFKPIEEDFEIIDASDHLIMPGLINMHTHAYMTVMRNIADDVDFNEWLFNRIEPVENQLTAEEAYWANLLAMEEMIRTGTTSFVDMHMFQGQSAKAAKEAGVRGFIGRGLVGEDLYKDGESRFNEALKEKDDFSDTQTLEFVLSPHAIYNCSDNFYSQVDEEAKEKGMLKQTHLSESDFEVEECIKNYGKTPVEVLNDSGFLDENTLLAHCVKLNEQDMEIIKNSGSHVITNPASNAKLGNGFAPISELREKGINICLGTDGTSSNNTLNLFREMGLLSLMHKAHKEDSTALDSEFVIKTVTENAAKALGKQDKLGVIKEGALADLIFLDLNAVSLFPNNNIISSLCYSANGSEVDTVMINGKLVMRDNKLLTIDSEQVRHEVKKIADRLSQLGKITGEETTI